MKPLSDLEIELDHAENAGRTTFAENVVGVCLAGMAAVLVLAGCMGCGK